MAKQKFDQTEENLANIEEAIGRTEKFVENNKNNITYGIIAIFVIVLLIMGYNKYILIPNEEEAYNSIWIPEQSYNQDKFEEALNGYGENIGFLEIIDEYGSTKSGNLANYYAGICYMKLAQNDTTEELAGENFELAIKHLSKFSSDDHNVMPMAIGAIGDCKMELGDTKKAASQYMKAAHLNDNNFTSPLFLQKAGMTYSLLGDHKKALEAFNEIQTKYADSHEGREVKKYIAREEELAKK